MSEKSTRLARQERLRKRGQYLAVYRGGEKVHTPHFVLYALENNLDHHRLGVTVSKKIGKAVIRSRVKRQFREIFRSYRHLLPSFHDLVFNARRTAARAAHAELRRCFEDGVARGLRRNEK